MITSLYGSVLSETGIVPNQRVDIEDDRIIAVETDTSQHSEHLILPGLADLHNHGGAGASFPTDGYEDCLRAARHHRQHGSTTLLASTVSAREEVLLPQLEMLAQLAAEGEIDGIHAEGPFVNSCRCGAQDPDAIIPGDPRLFRAMIQAAQGQLRSMTFAPETENAAELIDLCAEHNIIVSLGHTDANYPETMSAITRAVDAGATVTATHLFNAMPSVHHRNPGPVAAFLSAATKNVAHLELIADGVHLHPDTVATVLNSVGADRVTFVSDAMGAAGKSDGDYVLGALAVTVAGGVARLTTTDGSEGAIAGGTSRVLDQVRGNIAGGRAPEEIICAATTGHALLGHQDRGRVAAGYRADLIVCDANYKPLDVYRAGVIES